MKGYWIAGGALVAVLLILRGTDIMAPRGIRYNNPGNLEPMGGGRTWVGQDGVVGRFLRFVSAFYGLRAASREIYQSGALHGFWNLHQLIGDPEQGWAPTEDDNDVQAYVETVADVGGFNVAQRLDFKSFETNWRVLKGIVRAENGQKFPGVEWFSDATLKQAVLSAMELAK